LTALVRGELSLMWNFSEESEEEEEGKEKAEEKDGEMKKPRERESVFSLSDKKAQEREKRMQKALGKHLVTNSDGEGDKEDSANNGEKTKDKVKAVAGHRSRREVFSFSIEAPHDLKQPRSLIEGKKGQQVKDKNTTDTEEHELQSGPTVADKDKDVDGHAAKRVRLD